MRKASNFEPAVRTALAALLTVSAAGGAGAVERGGRAPHFILPRIEDGAMVSSVDYFDEYRTTFLVFWDTGCEDCAVSLSEAAGFEASAAGPDLAVLGITPASEGLLSARNTARVSGTGFTHLHDAGGAVHSAYGVPRSSFAILMVDMGGVVSGMEVDPGSDVGDLMESMLLRAGTPEPSREERPFLIGAEDEEPGGTPLAGEVGTADAGLAVSGDARIKYVSVDTRGEDPAGPYGEPLPPGNDLLHRLHLKFEKRVGDRLRVGGLLRISNEGTDVLRSGPYFFDSRWGSLFAAFDLGRLDLRLGYFTTHMTPLTLMRWDWDDNPRTGGDTGCNCGAAGAVAIVRSLEELGPDLTFEGAAARYSSGGFEADLFYAMPRRARTTPSVEYSFGGEETAAYSLEMTGLRARWSRFDERTGRFWSAGLDFVGSWEDPRSVDAVSLGYAPFARYTSGILTASVGIPVTPDLGAEVEWIVFNRTDGHNLGPAGDDEAELEGAGGIAGIVYGFRDRIDIRADYVRLEEGFYSPFAALSYDPGRHGARVNGRLLLPGGRTSLSVFYKRLEELERPVPGAGKDAVSFAGVSLDALIWRDELEASVSYLDRGEWREGDLLSFDETRETLTVTARWRMMRDSYLEGMYQRIENTAVEAGEETESDTNLYTVYFRSEF